MESICWTTGTVLALGIFVVFVGRCAAEVETKRIAAFTECVKEGSGALECGHGIDRVIK